MGVKKTAKKNTSKKETLASRAVSAVKGALGGKSTKGGKKRRKTALWYANAIHKLRLKRKYDRLRLGGR